MVTLVGSRNSMEGAKSLKTWEQDKVEQDMVEQDMVEQDKVEEDKVEQDMVEQDMVEQDKVEESTSKYYFESCSTPGRRI